MEQGDILEVRNLVKRREQAGVAFELRVPSLTIGQGKFVGIVGPSGCGKSTLVDLLALISKPTRVERFCFHVSEGYDIADYWTRDDEAALAALRRQNLGYVLQTGGLFPFLSVQSNLELPFLINDEPIDSARIRDLAERLHIEGILDKKPQYLSGGQRQRVALLRAIVRRNALILADEPTAAVDRERAVLIVEELGQLAKSAGATVLMITHDKGLLSDIADEIIQFSTTYPSEALTVSTTMMVTHLENTRDGDAAA